ncbi:hypothetical protein K402DRAFT_405741 [Aulographum hederae CBS 113979]|uniref:Uncharacterized protein n=1 Tax=Aulographum hederae CBS 113979 TaxID=1176131 RepID=A0A6G1GUL5_9PEZI|nr:hypothetical protein K402DRAFT_405741 [Aulographum hederae CBS 113979]
MFQLLIRTVHVLRLGLLLLGWRVRSVASRCLFIIITFIFWSLWSRQQGRNHKPDAVKLENGGHVTVTGDGEMWQQLDENNWIPCPAPSSQLSHQSVLKPWIRLLTASFEMNVGSRSRLSRAGIGYLPTRYVCSSAAQHDRGPPSANSDAADILRQLFTSGGVGPPPVTNVLFADVKQQPYR